VGPPAKAASRQPDETSAVTLNSPSLTVRGAAIRRHAACLDQKPRAEARPCGTGDFQDETPKGCIQLEVMMSALSFSSRDANSPLFRSAVLTLSALFALSWGSAAFCGEIHDAARNGDVAKVQALLKDHPDWVFSKDSAGETPLHLAAAKGFEDVARLLLVHKAKVNAQDSDGRTPLHLAAQGGHKGVLELLLASNAEVNAKDNKGWTPLHFAASLGRKDVAEMLLADRAEVNAADASGDTPLHLAAFEGHADVAEVLLTERAEVNAQDNEGWTPLCGAAQRGGAATKTDDAPWRLPS